MTTSTLVEQTATSGAFLGALRGSVRYEFFMQIRRRSLWIGLLLLSAVLAIAFFSGAVPYLEQLGAPHSDLMISWATLANAFFTLGAGLFLADRFPRDQRTHVRELLISAPVGPGARLLGKYVGAVLGTGVPCALFYVLGAVGVMIRLQDLTLTPLVIATFIALVVPAIIFVGAFAIACTTLLWPPLFQFLFVGYMLWTGLNNTEIPTLSGTLLSPYLNYVVTGFFSFRTFDPIDARIYPTSSIWLGIANILVLLLCAVVALLAAWGLELWRTRQT
jgi:hypothetical protein